MDKANSRVASPIEPRKITTLLLSGTVERQAAHFYRITVTESDLKSGLIITCKSTGKDKFKLVFFDQEVSCKCFLIRKLIEIVPIYRAM